MGTLYTLPVLSYPNLPTASGQHTNNYDDCYYGLNHALIMCQTSTVNGVGTGSSVAGTVATFYPNPNDTTRIYGLALNIQSDWLGNTVSISNATASGYRVVGWWSSSTERGVVRDMDFNKLELDVIVDLYNSYEEALAALPIEYPITYRLVNATAPTAPTSARVGDTVTVPLAFSEGYGVVNPSSDAYVTCNGVIVPSTYSNGVLTFNMPYPGA